MTARDEPVQGASSSETVERLWRGYEEAVTDTRIPRQIANSAANSWRLACETNAVRSLRNELWRRYEAAQREYEIYQAREDVRYAHYILALHGAEEPEVPG